VERTGDDPKQHEQNQHYNDGADDPTNAVSRLRCCAPIAIATAAIEARQAAPYVFRHLIVDLATERPRDRIDGETVLSWRDDQDRVCLAQQIVLQKCLRAKTTREGVFALRITC
jgi:hypothetical protein